MRKWVERLDDIFYCKPSPFTLKTNSLTTHIYYKHVKNLPVPVNSYESTRFLNMSILNDTTPRTQNFTYSPKHFTLQRTTPLFFLFRWPRHLTTVIHFVNQTECALSTLSCHERKRYVGRTRSRQSLRTNKYRQRRETDQETWDWNRCLPVRWVGPGTLRLV